MIYLNRGQKIAPLYLSADGEKSINSKMRILCKRKKPFLFFLFLIGVLAINAQDSSAVQTKEVDAYDVIRNIFGVSQNANSNPKKNNAFYITILQL